MQLVLHAPFGSRINKAWGLALRKRFCRQFNFELQAAATEDALLLSLGPQHSFPLADVFRYLHPATARDVLVQAFLDAPVFQTRWRWNTTISLAVPRNRGGRKVPPQLQRMLADDLMAAVVPGRRRLPREHPRRSPDSRSSARQRRRCATASRRRWTSTGCARCSTRIHRGELRLRRARHARAVAASRTRSSTRGRTRSSTTRRSRSGGRTRCRRGGPATARRRDDLGALDAAAIERVRDEARPDPRDADELHDALLTAGFLTGGELDGAGPRSAGDADRGAAGRRPSRCRRRRRARVWVAAERLPELLAVHPDAVARAGRCSRRRRARRASWTRERRDRRAAARPADARRADHRRRAGRAARHRPPATSTRRCSRSKREGVVLRGRFTPGGDADARMVRPRAARAHPPLHAQPAARRDRAGQPGRLHALPVRAGSTSSRRRG